MAGSWIKITHETPDKPEIVQLAELLHIDHDAALGKCIRFWIWADQQTIDGDNLVVSPSFIDRLTSCPGFAAGLLKVGWLSSRNSRTSIPNFDRHNGQSAKQRALTFDRSKRFRNAKTVAPSYSYSTSVEGVGGAGGFDRWWSSWPRHERKSGKSTCRKIWEKEKLEPLADAILAGLERWKRSKAWASDNRKYIPLPATWLNQRRWEDDDLVEVRSANPAAQPKPYVVATEPPLSVEDRKRAFEAAKSQSKLKESTNA